MSPRRPLRFRGWSNAPARSQDSYEPSLWQGPMLFLIAVIPTVLLKGAGWVTGWFSVLLYVILVAAGFVVIRATRRTTRSRD